MTERIDRKLQRTLAGLGLLSFGLAILPNSNQAQAKQEPIECSWDRGLAWSADKSTLSAYSECEGAVFPVFPLTEKQEEARVRANVLTTNLGQPSDRTRYEWLNLPYQELPLDRVGGGRLMADAELLEIMKGNTKTPEGSERIEALQLALNNYTSEQWGMPVTLDFNSLTNFYIEDRSQPNDISQLTVPNLNFFGVKDADLFRDNARIHFRNGVPYEVKEWQTGLRIDAARPNHVIAEIPSKIGDYSVVIEESGLEGWIQLSGSDTRRGVRSQEVPISIMLAPVKEDPNYVMMIVMDRSCGNIIEMYPVPVTTIQAIEELIAEMTFTPTAIPTSTNRPSGGGGGGQPEQPTSVPPTGVPPTERPIFTPQPTQAIQPTVVPPTSVPPTARPIFTPQPTAAIQPQPTAVQVQPTARPVFTPSGR